MKSMPAFTCMLIAASLCPFLSAGLATPALAAPAWHADSLGFSTAIPAALQNEDAVVLFAGDYFILHDDGRIDRGEHRVIRLASDHAIGRFGDPRVLYDSLRQELIVHTCRTITPDGRTVDLRPHAVNPVTADGVSFCADDLDWQEAVITHLGLERGCTVELDVEIRDRYPYASWLEGIVPLAMDYPVLQRTISVKCPAGVRLRAAVENGEAQATAVEGAGDGAEGPARIHVWQARDIPAMRESDDGCNGCLTRPRLLFSTCASWDALAERAENDFRAAAASSDSSLTAWVEKMLRKPDVLTMRDRARAVVDLTSHFVRGTSGAAFERYRAPRPAERTFATSCGTVFDRAALALALLEQAGIPARLALCPAAPEPAREIPMFAQFARVYLEPDFGSSERPPLLDPLSPDPLECPLDWHDRPLLFVSDARDAGKSDAEAAASFSDGLTSMPYHRVRAGEWSTPSSAEGVHGDATVMVSLHPEDKDALTGVVDLSISGILCPSGRPGDVSELASSYANRILPGATVTSCETQEIGPSAASIRFAFRVDKLPRDTDGRTRLLLPDGPESVTNMLAPFRLQRSERTTALCLPGRIHETISYRVVLPDGCSLEYCPASMNVANAAGSFTMTADAPLVPREPNSSGASGAQRCVTILRELTLAGERFDPPAYPALRQLMRAYAQETGRLVILGKEEAKARM